MKHLVTIDSQREQRPQWRQLVETVTFLVGRLLVAIVVAMLMIGLSLTFVEPGNAAHAAPAKSLTQAMAAIGSPSHHHHRHHHRTHHRYH